MILGKQISGDEDFVDHALVEIIPLVDPEFTLSVVGPKEDSVHIGSYHLSPRTTKFPNFEASC